MDMSESFILIEKFLAISGWMFRWSAGKWWKWNGNGWTHLNVRDTLAGHLNHAAEEAFLAGHKVRTQVKRDYMIDYLIKRLRPRLHTDVLPARTSPGDPPPSQ